ncbi:MAG: hypothetical protein LC785_02485 [Acidobacteria bacterium]|nr:hypothetical protein [Acidobacteriota bacterium]MCA1640854.1 hypothetical protein [Acidobacteriota bacterium]
MSEREENLGDPLDRVYWRDEVLQVMYWMTGEGFGQEFAAEDLRKFLSARAELLAEVLEEMAGGGLLERAGAGRYALTAAGRKEGGRRFADEFEQMLKPGHFECDEPDCDCHDPGADGAACKHFLSEPSTHTH